MPRGTRLVRVRVRVRVSLEARTDRARVVDALLEALVAPSEQRKDLGADNLDG